MANSSLTNLSTTATTITEESWDESDIKSASIELYGSSMAYSCVSIAVSFAIVLLNVIEILLIWKKWSHVSRFEIVLLNLAIADALTGALYVSVTGVDIHYQVTGAMNYTFYTILFDVGIFSVSSSGMCVLVIGVERLSAVRAPLKHRMSSSKRKMGLQMAAVWLLCILATIAMALTDYLTHRNDPIVSIASKDLALTLAVLLLLLVALILGIYFTIAYFVLNRHSAFLVHDKKDVASQWDFANALKKEKPTIIVCLLVVVSYLICNVPFAIELLKLRVKKEQTLLMIFNSALNPLVYFFKGFAEKYSRNNNLPITSPSNLRRDLTVSLATVNEELDSTSTQDKTE